jgi:hypothetical protein
MMTGTFPPLAYRLLRRVFPSRWGRCRHVAAPAPIPEPNLSRARDATRRLYEEGRLGGQGECAELETFGPGWPD